jgi:hypothetical protein
MLFMQQIFCKKFTLLLEELSNLKERKGSEVIIAFGKLRFSYHLSLKYHPSSGHVALQVASLQIMAASVIFLARFRFEFSCNCQPRLYNLKLVFVKPCVGAKFTLCACLDFCRKDEKIGNCNR